MSRRPRRARAERASQSLDRLLRRQGLYAEMRRYRAIEVWPDVVGAALARVTEPLRLVEGALVVRVRSASWRVQLHHMLPELLIELNRRLEEPLREIRLVSGGPSSRASSSGL